MKILISGAGIGGLTLAYWLHRSGHQPIIVEKAPDIRPAGYIIDFAGTGWEVANRMNIIPQLEARSYPMTAITYKDRDNRTTSRLSLEKVFRVAQIHGNYLGLNRSDLVEVLYEQVRETTEIRFGKSIQTICQSMDEVAVRFSDGTEEAFDLLIGADGIHSNVRQLAFGAESQFAHYLGYYVTAFYTPPVAVSLEDGYVMHVIPNVQVGVYAIKPDCWLTVIVYKTPYQGYIPLENRVDVLREHLRHVGWLTPGLLAQLQPQQPIFLDDVTQIKMPAWSNNRVALIGDAAHCLTLISGQGASMAMAGAYFLAEELARSSDHYAAFAAYERRLRPHIQERQRRAENFAPTFVPSTQFRIRLTNWVLKLVDAPLVARFVGKQFSIDSILDVA